MNLTINPIQDSRDTAEQSRLQLLHVIKQLQRIPAVITMRESLEQSEYEDTLLEGVTVG
jgi:hypothetical protein